MPAAPRWARINRCVFEPAADDALFKALADAGFTLINRSYDELVRLDLSLDWPSKSAIFSCRQPNLAANEFRRDPDIPDLLEFAPGVSFHDHPLLTSGQLVLQDKVGQLRRGQPTNCTTV